MEERAIEELIAKYNEGLTDPFEVQQLEALLESGAIDLTQLRHLAKLEEQVLKIEAPLTSLQMDDRFYAMLSKEKKATHRSVFTLNSFFSVWPMQRLAFGSLLLIGGFAVGFLVQRPGPSNDVAALTQQVGEMKEMMMLSLLEKESVTDRLKAVSLSTEMNKVSLKVTEALFQTLNRDENVNVRLAALEAIKPFARESPVRSELIRSIGLQQSPLVQMALAELMVQLQEKGSVGALEKLLEDKQTPAEIKTRIQESIDVLI